jgi:hypothetical protein
MPSKPKWKGRALICALFIGLVVTAINPTPEMLLALVSICIALLLA